MEVAPAGEPAGSRPLGPDGDGEAGVPVASSIASVCSVCDEILSASRQVALIGLTSRPGEQSPAVSALAVRQIVGDEVGVYFIPTGELTYALCELLPERLGVFGGAARLWWPGVSEASDPRDHPLIYDGAGDYGDSTLTRIAAAYRNGPPRSYRSVEGETLLERVVRQRDEALRENERLREQLRAVERDLQHATSSVSRSRNAAPQ